MLAAVQPGCHAVWLDIIQFGGPCTPETAFLTGVRTWAAQVAAVVQCGQPLLAEAMFPVVNAFNPRNVPLNPPAGARGCHPNVTETL